MMRILMVLETCGGGSGRHVLDLTATLAAQGEAVTVVYAPDRAEPDFLDELLSIKGIATHAVSMKRAVGLHDVGALNRLTRCVKEIGPFDILHGHSSKAGALVRMLPKSVPGARIYTPHAFRTMDPTISRRGRFAYSQIERILSSLCSCVLVGSRQEADAAAAIGIAPSKTHIIPFGVRARALPSREEARHALGLDPTCKVVGFVGRLAPQKAPERLIDAFSQCHDPDARLVLIGHGELEHQLRRRALALGMEGRITFAGALDGPLAMPAFDVLAVPSRYESLAYVLLEATAAGIPMVSTPVGVAETAIAPNVNGLIVENTDEPQAWAEALNYALDADILSDWQKAAHNHRDTDCIQRMTEAVLECYRMAASNAAAAN